VYNLVNERGEDLCYDDEGYLTAVRRMMAAKGYYTTKTKDWAEVLRRCGLTIKLERTYNPHSLLDVSCLCTILGPQDRVYMALDRDSEYLAQSDAIDKFMRDDHFFAPEEYAHGADQHDEYSDVDNECETPVSIPEQFLEMMDRFVEEGVQITVSTAGSGSVGLIATKYLDNGLLWSSSSGAVNSIYDGMVQVTLDYQYLSEYNLCLDVIKLDVLDKLGVSVDHINYNDKDYECRLGVPGRPTIIHSDSHSTKADALLDAIEQFEAEYDMRI